MRVGPSHDYRIEWVYRGQGRPVKVGRVVEGWRLVSDPDGGQGWVVARLLDPRRSAIVIGQGLAAIREDPSDSARLKCQLRKRVLSAFWVIAKRAGANSPPPPRGSSACKSSPGRRARCRATSRGSTPALGSAAVWERGDQ